MQRSPLRLSSVALASMCATSAAAQVTPEQVWQSWQKMGVAYGSAIVADSVVPEGDTLIVSDMKMSMDQGNAKVDGSIDQVRFRDLGNGTVQITMTDTYTIAMTLPAEDGQLQDVKIKLTQPGLIVIAGGTPTKTDYSYVTPTLNLDATFSEGQVTMATVKANLTSLSGTYSLEDSPSAKRVNNSLSVDQFAFVIDGNEAPSTARVTGSLSDLKIATSGTLLDAAAMADLAQAMRDGFSVAMDLSYGNGNFVIEAQESGKTTTITALNQTGSFRLGLADGAFRYAAGGTGVSLTASGGDIPFPEVKLTYAEASFDLLMPLLKSDLPSDFSLALRLRDLTVSDDVWGMFDPTVALPRSPATLVVETSGKAKLTTDLVDEAAMAALGDAPPGEINALTLKDLTLRLAGAEVTGAGALIFDNTDLATFDGVPAPTGKIDMLIKGANGLLDKLVAMGMVSADEAMGTRMMMAVIAKPAEGQDVLTSTLEFRDKGFYANGQRLK